MTAEDVCAQARVHHYKLAQVQQQQNASGQLYSALATACLTSGRGAASGGSGAASAVSVSPVTRLVTNHLLEPMRRFDKSLDYYSHDAWINTGDARTSRLPLLGASPWRLIAATCVYLYLIKWFLPRLMKQRKPLELNWPIRAYNLAMIVSNMWAFYHGSRILNFGAKCFGCEIIDERDSSPQALELLHYGWLFFLSRLVEWLDTVFFVLRKKQQQVTKLHVFHHSFVPLISWTYLKYHPGVTMAFFPLVNSLVHSIMYTYYFLATFGPTLQPYLWWKRYLTSLQIVQFVLILVQLASIPLTGNEQCQYPRGFLYAAIAGCTLFLWLFYCYYVDTYTKQQQAARIKHQQLSSTATQEQVNSEHADARHTLAQPECVGVAAHCVKDASLVDASACSSHGAASFGPTLAPATEPVRRFGSPKESHTASQKCNAVPQDTTSILTLAKYLTTSTTAKREGNSRALSDSIDDAIGYEPTIHFTDASHRKHKSHLGKKHI